MRIETNNDFARRPNEIMNEKPKYFLIYEGAVTEPMYFNGIMSNRDKLSINESISLISVLRNLQDSSKSHPKFALKLANAIKIKNEKNIISREDLSKSIYDFIKNKNLPNEEELINIKDDYIENYMNDFISVDDLDNVIMDIYKGDTFNNIVEQIIQYLKNQIISLDYNPDIDIINLIVDRDAGSFKSEQYDKLVKDCFNNKIKLYVSNPCFEVWLLMHFDEFDNLDFKKLLENKRINSKKGSKKYSEKMLSDIIGYNKSNLKFDLFIDKIEAAIKREGKYCENVEKLKNHIGSNIGLLINEIKK